MRHRIAGGALCLLGLALAGCSGPGDEHYPTGISASGGGSGNPASSAVVSKADLHGWDRRLLEIAQELPFIAAVSFDHTTDEAVVHTVDLQRALGESERVRLALNARGFRSNDRGPLRRVRFVPSRFDAQSLLGWRVRARELLGDQGVSVIDLDDYNATIRVEVTNSTHLGAVAAHLRALGIPAGAVTIIVAPAWFPSATIWLAGKHRPTLGGLELSWKLGSATYLCTLGLNAYRNGVRGFLTNSHCSDIQGAVDGESFYQDDVSIWNLIGTEQLDPGFWSGGACPPGRVCRRSDALWGSYNETPTSAGKVAVSTTIGSGSTPGSLVSTVQYAVDAAGIRSVTPGCCSTLYKTGRTTGTTAGSINKVCFDTPLSSSNKTLLCQSSVTAPSGAGDSGSPVFSPPDGNGMVEVYGLLWAGNCLVGTCTEYTFSDGDNIVADLPGLVIQ
jgi:hypothetical protein